MNIHPAVAPSQRTLRSFSKYFCLACALAACVAATATAAQAQTSQARPVARLITSSREVRPDRARRVASSPPAASAVATTAHAPKASSATSVERRAFDLINTERRAKGEEPLVWDEELCRMARRHSEDMAQKNFFSHAGPDGDTVDRARSLGIRGWSALGENIAYNQGFDDPAGFAVERWMGSPKHRANILSGMFTRSGLGIARATDGRIFFTQVFVAR
ncbi:MAG: CAP domain-containing protein [Pyrinomonadaceae bacterium]